MKKNISSADRMARLLIAALSIILYFTGTLTGTVGIVFLVVGLVLALTAFINFCPIYAILGIRTNKTDSKS